MINYKNSIQINPRHHYFNIDFNSIKTSLSSSEKSVLDYGSIFVIQSNNNLITIDNIGRINVYFDKITPGEISSIIKPIESAFLQQQFYMDYPSECSFM